MIINLLVGFAATISVSQARVLQPNEECNLRLTSLMAHAACTPSIYWRGRCGDNVANLVREARAWGIAIEDAEVLVLQHESRKVPPVPVPFDYPLEPAPAPARGRPPQWKFHVILALHQSGRTMILDLDYSDHPVEVDEYFNGLFPPRNVSREYQSEDRMAALYLRRVPLHEYLETHERLGGDGTALHYREKQSLITARTFINDAKPKQH